jgi:hypothetical protein
MLLPSQSQPVQRTLVGRPFGDGSATDLSVEGNEQAMRASEYGVQPSQDWGKIAQGVLQTLPAIFSLF